MQNQPLATVALSAIHCFDGTDKSNTMPWLEQVEVVAERNNQTSLEVGMAKLKGTPICNVHKIQDLTWPLLWKLLIENYSDTPYISDAMVANIRISQAEDESVWQYSIHAKDYLQCINHTSRLASMDSSGLNHVSLVQGLNDNYVRRRASKDAENWKTMADAFDSIAKIVRTTGKTKAYNEPRYEKSTYIHAISNSYNNREVLLTGTRTHIKITMLTVGTTVTPIHPGKTAAKNQCVTTVQVPTTSQSAHNIKRIKVKYKCTTQQVKQNLQGGLKLGAKKNSICVNEAYFKNEEDDDAGNYSEEQAIELCKLLDTDSEWLNIREEHVNEVGDDTSLMLYKVRVNNQPAIALFDTGASMSVISSKLFDSLQHKPKILQCNQTLRGAGGEALIPKNECFLQIKIGKQMFSDRVVIINNLNHN